MIWPVLTMILSQKLGLNATEVALVTIGLIYDNFGSVTAWVTVISVLALSIVGALLLIFADKKSFPDLYKNEEMKNEEIMVQYLRRSGKKIPLRLFSYFTFIFAIGKYIISLLRYIIFRKKYIIRLQRISSFDRQIKPISPSYLTVGQIYHIAYAIYHIS